ncbi:hypothetical protein F5Y19DRAFT_267395 [Xylariaceae sp. FL1651]|nr:hypothetical protein F5Y19DRAFT_267395 [Xylariaceae sp. FL1651]
MTQPAKALPSLTSAQRQRFIEIASRGWKVKYQQRSTLTESVLVEIEYELPREDVCQLLCQSLSSSQPDRFPFPIAFSKDLGRVVVLRTLITLIHNNDSQSTSINQAFKVQKLGQPNNTTVSRTDKTIAYSPTFSPTGIALAFVIGTSKATQFEQRVIEIWSQKESDSYESDYLFRGSLIASWLNAVKYGSNVSFGFVFHPRFPVIAVSEWMRISAWQFNDQPSEQRVCLISRSGIPKSFPHSNILRFSSLQLQSHERFPTSKPSEMIVNGNLLPQPDPSGDENMKFESTDIDVNIQWFIDLFDGPYRTHDLEDHSLSLISETTCTDDSDWAVRRIPLTNAVILEHRTLSEDARALLTHLPRTHAHEQTYISMLRFSENDQWMRLVYNKDAQKSYSCQDQANPYLPAIISRKLSTIEPCPQEYGSSSLKRKAVENKDGSKSLLKKRISELWRGR